MLFKLHENNCTQSNFLKRTSVTPAFATSLERHICRRYGVYNATTGSFSGILGVFQRKEADTLLFPFPMDLDGDQQVMDYGPVFVEEYTTLMNVYNTSFRNADVLTSFSSFDVYAWTLFVISMTLIASVLHVRSSKQKDSLLDTMRMTLGQGLDMDRLRSNIMPSFALFFIALFFLFAVFENLINANAATLVKTATFRTLRELTGSEDYAPIWIRHGLNAKVFNSNPIFVNSVSETKSKEAF